MMTGNSWVQWTDEWQWQTECWEMKSIVKDTLNTKTSSDKQGNTTRHCDSISICLCKHPCHDARLL